MKTVGAYEAKTHFSQLLAEVEAGEVVTITKHGMPVAEVWPCARGATMTKAEAVERMKKFPKAELPEGVTIKDMIDWGRRF